MSQPLIMSFRPAAAAMCLDGRKTQTRRIWKPEWHHVYTITGGDPERILTDIRASSIDSRVLWRVGDFITIKPSRTAKGIGRVRCTGLAVERVELITEEDARREGITVCPLQERTDPSAWWQWEPGGETFRSARMAFRALWRSLHPTGPKSWDENPLVVVIEFEPVSP